MKRQGLIKRKRFSHIPRYLYMGLNVYLLRSICSCTWTLTTHISATTHQKIIKNNAKESSNIGGQSRTKELGVGFLERS